MSSERRALITGVAGFLGRYTARHLAEVGWSVVGVDQVAPENASLELLDRYEQLRLPDPRLASLVAELRPDACVHCAGRAAPGLSMTAPADDFQENVVTVFELLEALRLGAPACRVVLLSSAAVYGSPASLPVTEGHAINPLSPYGFHKRQAEILAAEFAAVYGMATASLRIFSAYGVGLRRQVVWDIARKALTGRGEVALRGTGRESRDFVHASDIARAIGLVLERATMSGETYNLASGAEVSVETLARLVLEALGVERRLSFDGKVPEGTPLNWRADIGALERLGFSAEVPLSVGVERFARWCRGELGYDDER